MRDDLGILIRLGIISPPARLTDASLEGPCIPRA